MIVSVQFSVLWQQVAEILHEMLFMLMSLVLYHPERILTSALRTSCSLVLWLRLPLSTMVAYCEIVSKSNASHESE